VAYQQSDPRGKSKSSTIVILLDPSTQDKKEVILENGDILWPFIHEVKGEKMYGGGACCHVMDQLLVWMKLEHCTLFVGCTSTFLEFDNDVTNTNDKDDSTYDERYFWEGKLQYTKYLDPEYYVYSVSINLFTIINTILTQMMTIMTTAIQRKVGLQYAKYLDSK
jgi:hypothetical protein